MRMHVHAPHAGFFFGEHALQRASSKRSEKTKLAGRAKIRQLAVDPRELGQKLTGLFCCRKE